MKELEIGMERGQSIRLETTKGDLIVGRCGPDDDNPVGFVGKIIFGDKIKVTWGTKEGYEEGAIVKPLPLEGTSEYFHLPGGYPSGDPSKGPLWVYRVHPTDSSKLQYLKGDKWLISTRYERNLNTGEIRVTKKGATGGISINIEQGTPYLCGVEEKKTVQQIKESKREVNIRKKVKILKNKIGDDDLQRAILDNPDKILIIGAEAKDVEEAIKTLGLLPEEVSGSIRGVIFYKKDEQMLDEEENVAGFTGIDRIIRMKTHYSANNRKMIMIHEAAHIHIYSLLNMPAEQEIIKLLEKAHQPRTPPMLRMKYINELERKIGIIRKAAGGKESAFKQEWVSIYRQHPYGLGGAYLAENEPYRWKEGKGYVPKYGFMEPYGASAWREDVAVMTEYIYGMPKVTAGFIPSRSFVYTTYDIYGQRISTQKAQDWSSKLSKKTMMLNRNGFLTEEAYTIFLEFVKKTPTG